MSLYKGARKNLTGFIKWLFRIHVHGSENEPENGGYLVCCNHISFVDVLSAAVAVKAQIRFMAKKELFKIPLLGWLIKTLGAFPVDRKGNAVAAIKKSVSLLESGEVVGMFPTGHRYKGVKFDTTRGEVKGGAAMAVFRSKTSVLPMFIATDKDKVALFRRIDIYVGKPIEYDEFGFSEASLSEYDRGAKLIFDRIAELAPPERRSK